MPPTSSAAAELLINRVDEDVTQFLHKSNERDHIPKNMTKEEMMALSSLAARKEITIKPADKGGSIVIMNTVQYEREILRQLADPSVYKCLETNPTSRVMNRIKQVVSQAVQNNVTDTTTQTYLIADHPVTPIIYVLPKIHKDPINPPGRPIVSSTASVTMPLAKYLDKCLTPLIIQTRSYIRDTQDFLNKICSDYSI